MFANIIPVFSATLVIAGLAVIWYSTYVFGRTYARALGQDPGIERAPTPAAIIAGLSVLFGALYTLRTLFMRFELQNDEAIAASALVAVIALLPVACAVIWEGRPRSYLAIHGTFVFVAIFMGGGIIAYWPW